MTLADQYAKALFDVVRRKPEDSLQYLKNLREALKRRGHESLLPQIFARCQTLEAGEKRRARERERSPEERRTRALVELYKKLTAR